MMSEQKKEWNVGDELAIHYGGRKGNYRILKITKTGRITLGNNYHVLNLDLRIRGLATWSQTHSSAYPVTDEIRQDITRCDKRRILAEVFRNLSQSILTDEEVDQIIAIYEAANQREEAKHAHRHQAD